VQHFSKIFVFALLVTAFIASVSTAQNEIALNGVWHGIVDKEKTGEKLNFFSSSVDTSGWSKVYVPSNFEPLGSGMDEFRGTCWFRRSFQTPASWRGRRVVVHFEGVNNQASVWINGKLAGKSIDPFLPCDIPIQDLLNYGKENSIAVSVNNEHPVSGVPTWFGWRSEGGILREIKLKATDFVYAKNIAITALPTENGGQLKLEAIISNESSRQANVKIEAQITDLEGRTIKKFITSLVDLAAFEQGNAVADVKIPGVQPWSPDAPQLYYAKLKLLANGKIVEEQHIRFGFRSIETKGTKLLLNGQPIYLIGFNRHEDSHHTGMAWDTETTRTDLLDMKRMGANFVRFAHYPHSPKAIDMCDEIGLLVKCEIPFYVCSDFPENWSAGGIPYPCGNVRKDEQWNLIRNSSLRQMETMIRRDRNHPSVIIWSAGNECNESLERIRQLNNELVLLTKKIDPSRLATHVSIQNHWPKPELITHEHDDIVSINCYGYMNYGSNAGNWIDKALDVIHKKHPYKPVLITEFGNWEIKKSSSDANEVGGQKIADAIEYDFKHFQKPYICGSAVWCYADHRWPPRCLITEANGVSPYGVYTRDRKASKAVALIKKIFKQKNTR